MSKEPIEIKLQETDRKVLDQWSKGTSTEQRLRLRSRIVLAAHQGKKNVEIAEELQVRKATVSKWRNRFARQGIPGLQDTPRSGAPKKYGEETPPRILAQLDTPPPAGYVRWNGGLLAEALQDVSADYIWRFLRQHRISLDRRRSWCVSTDPQFAKKAADIVGLYLAPPTHAVVLSVDEKPHIQALERAQGWLRLPNGKALTGWNHEYKRHGTTTLFAAFDIATGQVQGGHYARRRRREFLDFMNEVVVRHPPDQQIHVILDNLNTHKPKQDRWLQRHKNVHFHFTPTHASWLNQVEVWFSILWCQALQGASFTSPKEVCKRIDSFIQAYNKKALPFEWKKETVYPKTLKNKYADLYK